MTPQDTRNILIVGLDATALAKSAHQAGYTVHAADHYGDQDLRQTCKYVLSIINQQPGKTCGRLAETFQPQKLLQLAKKLTKENSIDAILLASGLEDTPEILAELHDLAPIVGNSSQTIAKTRDKQTFFQTLKKLNIRHPKTTLAAGLQEAKKVAKDTGYPIIIKPQATLGGAGIRKANNPTQLETAFPSPPSEVLIQEFIAGTHASISLLSTKDQATLLTINEQLLGTRELGQKEPFGYCGNTVPLTPTNTLLTDACNHIAQKIATHLKLQGSNGIDIVISKDNTPHVVEVNPRFQGSLECTERVLGLNLVNAHINTCLKDTLPKLHKKQQTTHCTRLILYARTRSTAPNLGNFAEIRDIPLPSVIIEEGEPLCSIVVEEKTGKSALKKAKALANKVYETTEPEGQ